jgi:hypothetical protein
MVWSIRRRRTQERVRLGIGICLIGALSAGSSAFAYTYGSRAEFRAISPVVRSLGACGDYTDIAMSRNPHWAVDVDAGSCNGTAPDYVYIFLRRPSTRSQHWRVVKVNDGGAYSPECGRKPIPADIACGL